MTVRIGTYHIFFRDLWGFQTIEWGSDEKRIKGAGIGGNGVEFRSASPCHQKRCPLCRNTEGLLLPLLLLTGRSLRLYQTGCNFTQNPVQRFHLVVGYACPGLIVQPIRLMAQQRHQLIGRVAKMHLPHSAVSVMRSPFHQGQFFKAVDRLSDRGALQVKQAG